MVMNSGPRREDDVLESCVSKSGVRIACESRNRKAHTARFASHVRAVSAASTFLPKADFSDRFTLLEHVKLRCKDLWLCKRLAFLPFYDSPM